MYLFSKPASLLLTFLFSVTVDIMASRGCINSKDLFCYVCGWLTDKPHRKTFTPLLKKAYEAYFDSKVDSGKGWAPQFICLTCACNLRGWIRKAKKNNHLAFGVHNSQVTVSAIADTVTHCKELHKFFVSVPKL